MKNKIVCYLGLLLCMIFLPSCKKNSTQLSEKISHVQNLPKDLLYNNKPIPDEYMEELVPIICGSVESKEIDLDTFIVQKKIDSDTEKDQYEWIYIGTLPNGDHLIYGYWWPACAMGKFTEIAIVRRIGDKLKAIGWIEGGDRHATMINTQSCQLNGSTLIYHQHMTNGLLYATLMNEYPELAKYAKNKNNDELYWGESDYLGYGTFEVTITPQGKLENQHLVSFTLAKGKSDDNLIQKTPKASFTMGKAINQLLDYYFHIHKKDTFTLAQLNEVMIEACAYAKEERM